MQYIQIKQAIAEQIDTGILNARQKLPSERILAESFSTTRVTLREALSFLEAEGKIYREDRRGWFISPPPLILDPSLALSFRNIALSQQRTPSSQVIQAKLQLANKEASSLLSLPPFSKVYQIQRVHFLENTPVAYITQYIHPDTFPNLLDNDLSASVTEILQQTYQVNFQKTQCKITSYNFLADIAQALRSTEGTTAIKIQKSHFDQNDNLIISSIELWRANSISIEFSK